MTVLRSSTIEVFQSVSERTYPNVLPSGIHLAHSPRPLPFPLPAPHAPMLPLKFSAPLLVLLTNVKLLYGPTAQRWPSSGSASTCSVNPKFHTTFSATAPSPAACFIFFDVPCRISLFLRPRHSTLECEGSSRTYMVPFRLAARHLLSSISALVALV